MLVSPAISQCRLRALRQACLSAVDGRDPANGSEYFDRGTMLLFIAGQDGRSNAGSAAVLQYLLLGLSGRALSAGSAAPGGASVLSSSLLPDQLEDCVVAVCGDHCRVFVSGEACDPLSQLVSTWGYCVQWVLPTKDMDDVERSERFKVPV